MYDNKTHKVADRIVSIAQPYIRPIVRGKTKSPVEFGIKLDLSIDEDHMGRIEKITFDHRYAAVIYKCGNFFRGITC